MIPTAQEWANAEEIRAIESGLAHVFYGAAAQVILGAALMTYAFIALRSGALAVALMGLLVALLGTGIAVDVYAHTYTH